MRRNFDLAYFSAVQLDFFYPLFIIIPENNQSDQKEFKSNLFICLQFRKKHKNKNKKRMCLRMCSVVVFSKQDTFKQILSLIFGGGWGVAKVYEFYF